MYNTSITSGGDTCVKMLNFVLTNKEIASLGYISMTDYYLKVHVN